jgi:methionyl-tRNA synthetase
LPDNVPANEFLNLEGNKLSTSKNGRFGCTNIWDFPGQQDVYVTLTSNAPETDNDFTWKDFQARNNELVNGNQLCRFLNQWF